jgi:DNA-binding NtrC family response regulator
MPNALIALDREPLLYEISDIAEEWGFATTTARSLSVARSENRRDPPDLAIVGTRLGGGTGLDLLLTLDKGNTSHVVLLGDEEGTLDGLEIKEFAYLPHPPDLERLRGMIEAASREVRKRSEPEDDSPEPDFESMVGESEPMLAVYDLVEKVAPTSATVLVSGESGTGKELVARAIHRRSERAHGPFVALNCGAIPADLIDAELSGHAKGAFTGAHRSRPGAFERAQGGTLFLDEIVEMPGPLQVRLLRVLETRRIRRVGGNTEIDVDCRILAATNQRLERAIRDGLLREDLYYRLSEFPILIPPLRERGEDVVLLAESFLAGMNGASGTSKRFTDEALDLIRGFHWPGNVRQLKNAVRRAFIISENEIRGRALPAHLSWRATAGLPIVEVEVGASIEAAERRLIEATLSHFEGNKKQAARALGISLRTLYNRLGEYRESADDR